MLDPIPYMVWVKGLGLISIGSSVKAINIIEDIALQTLRVFHQHIKNKEDFISLSESDLFEMEYWSLEQAKLGSKKSQKLASKVIVITGGGSQLHSVRQLVEYLTGMDARIGYPNEHLGKSKIEQVKSPMFATSVGLVLAGYRSLDERENRYLEVKAQRSEEHTSELQSQD